MRQPLGMLEQLGCQGKPGEECDRDLFDWLSLRVDCKLQSRIPHDSSLKIGTRRVSYE